MVEQNGNNNSTWKTNVAEFRGFMRAKVENIEQLLKEYSACLAALKADVTELKQHTAREAVLVEEYTTSLKSLQDDVGELKQYVATQKTLQSRKSTMWGAIGGAVVSSILFLLRDVFRRVLGI